MELTEKVYDFAVTQRNGLCSLVVEECLTEIMTHTITILHFIVCGPDVAENPTLDCMHLISNKALKCYVEMRESVYFRTTNVQKVSRVTQKSTGSR